MVEGKFPAAWCEKVGTVRVLSIRDGAGSLKRENFEILFINLKQKEGRPPEIKNECDRIATKELYDGPH